jgi:oligopeptide/dipeptide ABC transporter ATP-binding protein
VDLEELLTVEDLKVYFPVKKGLFTRTVDKVHAVDGVSFTLRKGETLGIVGESGCGKTTTGLAILRLIEPTGGKVYFQGTDISLMTEAQMKGLRQHMQIIFQDPYSSLNPRKTVHRIIYDPMKIHGIYDGPQREERLAYLLRKVGLTYEQVGRYPHEFSGGQRQRISIARALVLNPQLIIADEPVSALDVSIQSQIINLLLELQEEFELSYIMISHDLAVIEHMCDRIMVMYLGVVVEMASYHDLYNDPRHPYTQALLSAIPVPDPKVSRSRAILRGDVPSVITPPSGCRFHPRCPSRMRECDKMKPTLRNIDGSHKVACFLYDLI